MTLLAPDETPWEGLEVQLEGWELFWAPVQVAGDWESSLGLLRAAEAHARQRWTLKNLSADPVVAAVRRLFRAAGCDPTRYRPSSEALLRRVLKGQELPSIHPLVDLNNCLSLRLAVPSCVVAAGSITPPLTLRTGRVGEEMLSLRGPFKLAGKPLLEDAAGPFGTPITDSERVKVRPETRGGYLVTYLPEGVLPPAVAERALRELQEG